MALSTTTTRPTASTMSLEDNEARGGALGRQGQDLSAMIEHSFGLELGLSFRRRVRHRAGRFRLLLHTDALLTLIF
ncbi:hypothetical protein Tco_1214401 [Tanacetum coccineum]